MKQLRGMKLHITLDLLLDLIGLERGNIELGSAAVDVDTPDVLVLVLRGNDERLPEVLENANWPNRTVICTTDTSRPGLVGKIEGAE